MKNRYFMMLSIGIDKRICYLCVAALLLGIAAWGIEQTVPVQPAAQAQADFSCTNVSQIPQSECEALVALYNANPTAALRNWLRTNAPCGWDGLGCANGHVTELLIWHQGLTSLPPEIGNLSSLISLNLSENRVTNMPAEIEGLSSLTKLIMPSNQLTDLPAEIGNLSSLKVLDVSNSQLADLPPEIGNLSSLTWLELGGNQLTSIPSEIGTLSSLAQLVMRNNQLTDLPPEIGNLSSLTSLDLGGNQLINLPLEIGNLSSLINLRVGNNQLINLPSEIGNLSSLVSASLLSNQLTSLPAEIGNLTSLTHLSVFNNQLTSLPAEIGTLSSLRSLWVFQNQLTSLPAEIGNMSELNSIKTFGNPSIIQPVQITADSFPSQSSGTVERSMSGPYYAIGSSVQLTAVPAADWQFDSWEGPDGVIEDSAISITIGEEDQTYTANFIEQVESGFNCANVSEIPQSECEALVTLHDSTDGAGWLNSTNWLQTDTPCSWFGVTCASGQVSRLKLDANQLNGTIPTELGNLTALYLLSLTDNQLSGPLPAELGDLATLQFLYLFKNQLSGAIPAELGNLAALKILALQENQLSGQIPTELGNLADVQRLFLHENQLSGQFPVELSNLPSLSAITLYDNPQLEQPVEIKTSSEGEGTIARNLTGPLYAAGTALQLTAVPATGWQFDYWEGPQISAEQSMQETVAITAGATNESYKAHFVLAIAAAHDSSLIEEAKEMLQDQGLRTGKTVDLLLPIVVK